MTAKLPLESEPCSSTQCELATVVLASPSSVSSVWLRVVELLFFSSSVPFAF